MKVELLGSYLSLGNAISGEIGVYSGNFRLYIVWLRIYGIAVQTKHSDSAS